MAGYRRNHVVSRSLIDLFSLERRVRCHFVRSGESKEIGTRNVAVRKNFYNAALDDGTYSTIFERSIGPVEAKASGVLREIEDRWPPNQEDRAILAEYMAIQAIRSPSYRYSFERAVKIQCREREANLGPSRSATLKRIVTSDQFRLEMMASQVAKMATLFGSMYWSIVRFGSPRLLSSDHPLAPVPIPRGGKLPIRPIPAAGFVNTIEIRFPISPTRALLMNWREHEDDFPVLDGRLHHLKSFNTATSMQAEEHWFHRPDVSAPVTSGTLTSLSAELFSDYGMSAAVTSERRRCAEVDIDRMIEMGQEEKMRILDVTRTAA